MKSAWEYERNLKPCENNSTLGKCKKIETVKNKKDWGLYLISYYGWDGHDKLKGMFWIDKDWRGNTYNFHCKFFMNISLPI